MSLINIYRAVLGTVLFLFSCAFSAHAERVLVKKNDVQVVIEDEKDWCKNKKANLAFRTSNPTLFKGDREEFQKIIGGVRAILGIECPMAKTIIIKGISQGKLVFRDQITKSNNWALTNQKKFNEKTTINNEAKLKMPQSDTSFPQIKKIGNNPDIKEGKVIFIDDDIEVLLADKNQACKGEEASLNFRTAFAYIFRGDLSALQKTITKFGNSYSYRVNCGFPKPMLINGYSQDTLVLIGQASKSNNWVLKIEKRVILARPALSEILLRRLTYEAKRGNSEKQFELGNIYYKGKVKWGVRQNYKEASKWYELAAKQDHRQAQIELSHMYYAGRGTPYVNTELGQHWAKEALKERMDERLERQARQRKQAKQRARRENGLGFGFVKSFAEGLVSSASKAANDRYNVEEMREKIRKEKQAARENTRKSAEEGSEEAKSYLENECLWESNDRIKYCHFEMVAEDDPLFHATGHYKNTCTGLCDLARNTYCDPDTGTHYKKQEMAIKDLCPSHTEKEISAFLRKLSKERDSNIKAVFPNGIPMFNLP